jgi:methyl-accepting chemotaxis protein
MKLRDMNLATRLGVVFSVVVAAAAGISLAGLIGSNRALSSSAALSGANHATVALANASNAMWTLRWGVAQFLASPAAADRAVVMAASAPAMNQFQQAMAAYRAMPRSDAELALLRELDPSFEKYATTRERWFALLNEGKTEEAAKLRGEELIPSATATTKTLNALIGLQQSLTDTTEANAAASLRGARLAQEILSAVVLLLAVSLAWLVTRSVVRQLGGDPRYATEVAKRVAAGDLSCAIDHNQDDEASLIAAMALMQDNLTGIVRQIKESTESIDTASRQIAEGNGNLSQRTEEQASSLEETAASIEELTGTVKQNADSAQKANQLAMSASGIAAKGGSVVKQVVDTMSEISQSSRQIGDIITVIDGIAFQTNILALNAAVEAARAGEQGRGFAVVASEVRNLAQRSAEAARQIKGLIQDSMNRVSSGARLVDEAGSTMQQIVASVKQVCDLIGEISAASAEQAASTDEVNRAIGQMDGVTQQNAALVEEVAAATESLRQQAQTLTRAVAAFKLARSAPAPAALPVRSPATRDRRVPAGAAPSGQRRAA